MYNFGLQRYRPRNRFPTGTHTVVRNLNLQCGLNLLILFPRSGQCERELNRKGSVLSTRAQLLVCVRSRHCHRDSESSRVLLVEFRRALPATAVYTCVVATFGGYVEHHGFPCAIMPPAILFVR